MAAVPRYANPRYTDSFIRLCPRFRSEQKTRFWLLSVRIVLSVMVWDEIPKAGIVESPGWNLLFAPLTFKATSHRLKVRAQAFMKSAKFLEQICPPFAKKAVTIRASLFFNVRDQDYLSDFRCSNAIPNFEKWKQLFFLVHFKYVRGKV